MRERWESGSPCLGWFGPDLVHRSAARTIAIVILTLAVVALVAVATPTLRIARIDLAQTLREE
jgi:ABC-type lipoprotein release transport system permease subunit